MFSNLFDFLFLKNKKSKRKPSLRKQIRQKLQAIKGDLRKKDWKTACVKMLHLNYMTLYSTQAESSHSNSDWRQALEALPLRLHKKYAPPFETLFKQLEDLSFSPNSITQKSALQKAYVLLKREKHLIYSFLSDI